MEDNLKYAAALKYDIGDDSAPKLIAKGKGFMAEKIVETAESAGVQTYKDAKLAKQLQNLELGVEIPKELYEVVAEVLIFIAKMDKGFKY